MNTYQEMSTNRTQRKSLQSSILDQLRYRYPLLGFLTDTEIEKFVSAVYSVSVATAVEPSVIMEYISNESKPSIGSC